jgi:hypothetical protein
MPDTTVLQPVRITRPTTTAPQLTIALLATPSVKDDANHRATHAKVRRISSTEAAGLVATLAAIEHEKGGLLVGHSQTAATTSVGCS